MKSLHATELSSEFPRHEPTGPGVLAQFEQLETWLIAEALPFQQAHARAHAGFHERTDTHGVPVDMPRRARVSARQLYSFSRLMAEGVEPQACATLAAHARDFFLAEHLGADGSVRPLAGGPDQFDLYDVAFSLFALAAADPRIIARDEAHAHATRVRQWLEAGWRNDVGGFEEAMPRRLPLRSNPHMHMLEACLEWERAQPEDTEFVRLADEIAMLCLGRFRATETGALCEVFDGSWAPLVGETCVIEPGHQYEWGWLLMRWGQMRGRKDATEAGGGLIDLAENHGLNAGGLAGTSLHADLSPADMLARLWPQTERIKAWALRARLTTDPVERQRAEVIAAEATAGLMLFFDHPMRGAWWENISEGGGAQPDNTRTSSFYHIVAAYAELRQLARLVAGRRQGWGTWHVEP